MLVHKIISIRSVIDAVTSSVAGRPRVDPYTPAGDIFYELRVTRGDVVSLSLLPRSSIRRGRPTGRTATR